MKHLKIFYIITILSFQTLEVFSDVYLDKIVSLQAGSNYTLKTIFGLWSNQTECTFSYNPLVLPDNKLISTASFNNLKLSVALKKVLPAGFIVTENNKYIVIQKEVPTNIVKISTVKSESRIDKNQKKVALVIPPEDFSEQKVDQCNAFFKDSTLLILPTISTALAIDSSWADKKLQNNFRAQKIDSSEIKHIKTVLFFRKNIHLQAGISSSSPLSTAIFQAGAYGVYGICSFSTDYNNSYRMGYGLGYSLSFENNMGLNLNLERHSLIGGVSYNLGVRASITQVNPLFTYSISRDFLLFIGPSLYMSDSKYADTNSDLGKTFGAGALIGVKFDIISAVFSKK
jgi:hypothetical protein